MKLLLIWLYNHFLKILVQHIKAILPGLKSRINSALVSAAKEHASYGEIMESKVYMIAKDYFYCWDFLQSKSISSFLRFFYYHP